ncbi:hypothetical protein JHK87_012296 [Glycine soja]|nr:hypothetical protein JHK87_012296 [Glycine soja]
MRKHSPSQGPQDDVSFSLRTISRTSALVQLSAVVSGDCVENEEEKEGDCVRIRQLPAVVPGDYVGNEEEKECDCSFLTYWFRQELPRIGTRKAPQRRNRQCRLRPEMESSNVKNKSSGKRKMSSEDTRSYFAWNLEIERVLADVLRDQRNLGNKGDGNWKALA